MKSKSKLHKSFDLLSCFVLFSFVFNMVVVRISIITCFLVDIIEEDRLLEGLPIATLQMQPCVHRVNDTSRNLIIINHCIVVRRTS